MAERIGHVLGWTGDILFGLFVLMGLARYFQVYEWIVAKITGSTVVYDPVLLAELNFLSKYHVESDDNLQGALLAEYNQAVATARLSQLNALFLALATGVIVFLMGRALRYIFSGRFSGRK